MFGPAEKRWIRGDIEGMSDGMLKTTKSRVRNKVVTLQEEWEYVRMACRTLNVPVPGHTVKHRDTAHEYRKEDFE